MPDWIRYIIKLEPNADFCTLLIMEINDCMLWNILNDLVMNLQDKNPKRAVKSSVLSQLPLVSPGSSL